MDKKRCLVPELLFMDGTLTGASFDRKILWWIVLSPFNADWKEIIPLTGPVGPE